jgi:hypothetical protein
MRSNWRLTRHTSETKNDDNEYDYWVLVNMAFGHECFTTFCSTLLGVWKPLLLGSALACFWLTKFGMYLFNCSHRHLIQESLNNVSCLEASALASQPCWTIPEDGQVPDGQYGVEAEMMAKQRAAPG